MSDETIEQRASVPMSEEDLLTLKEFYQGTSEASRRVLGHLMSLHAGLETISQVRWELTKWYAEVNQPRANPQANPYATPLAQCNGEKWVYRQCLMHLKFPLVEDMPPTKKE